MLQELLEREGRNCPRTLSPQNTRPWEEPIRSGLLILHQQMGPERPAESQCPGPKVEADACRSGRDLVWAVGPGRVTWWAPRPGEQMDASRPAWLVTGSPLLAAEALPETGMNQALQHKAKPQYPAGVLLGAKCGLKRPSVLQGRCPNAAFSSRNNKSSLVRNFKFCSNHIKKCKKKQVKTISFSSMYPKHNNFNIESIAIYS